jgi:hypothetical protein
MEKDQVPQDNENILEGKLRMLKYAVDTDGNYTKVPTVGWEPENVVLNQAWEDIHEKVALVKQKVMNGELSPIAYQMEKRMMDVGMLAGYTGFWKMTVRRHMKPKHYKNLTQQQLEKYAIAFQISVSEIGKLD